MEIDFELIKKLEQEIKALLEERPEYKEWFYKARAEAKRIGGSNPINRAAIALSFTCNKWFDEFPEAAEEFKKEAEKLQGEE